jgi:Do/DeqQ family serine protease
MKFKNIALMVAISAIVGFLSAWGFHKYEERNYYYSGSLQDSGKLPVNYAGFFGERTPANSIDFTAAATAATPAVVHIKTITKAKKITNNLPKQRNPFSDFFGDDFFDFFWGPQMPQMTPEQRASGSGVLISEDGYIVTNNHVIEKADEINITLSNKKSYKAKLIASDVNTDIAVLKIEGRGFPYVVYGNSDDVKLGQWVLAVGYPLNLDVTVTAGIISAKSRAIGINQGPAPIESFLQTDAAVNPGNSGGALINTSGELIGINSAIASPTGAYAGYSYAIPVNIVKKIVNDLIKYGAVQRAYLGIEYLSELADDAKKKELGVPDGEGVYVRSVADGGAAQQAGIKAGDIIIKINNVPVSSGSELQEQIARYKPGDKISVTYLRGGKQNIVNVTLKNKSGTYAEVKKETVLDKLGGELVTIDAATAKKNGIDGGVQVKKLGEGALKNSRIQEGFIIISINGEPIKNLDDLKQVLSNVSGTVRVEGIYPGYEETYGYPLYLDDNK